MSKSLKNFISIKELLKKYSARQIRLLFLLHKYDVLMNYNSNSFKETEDKDRKYYEFYLTIKKILRENPLSNFQKPNKIDLVDFFYLINILIKIV